MDLDFLTLGEAATFREMTGMSPMKMAEKLSSKPCQRHRLAIRHCGKCPKAPPKPMCATHEEEFEDCEECEGMDLPEDVVLALLVIFERRADPQVTPDQMRQLPYTEALRRLGNFLGDQASTKSTQPGSPPSSTSTRASRSRSTRR